MSDAELRSLRERAKELRCLYRVNDALGEREQPPEEAFRRVLAAIPDGFQHPEVTQARIEYFGRSYATAGHAPSQWTLSAALSMWQREVGTIEIVYTDLPAGAERDAPFLPQERELIDAIARRIAEYLEWKHQEIGGARIGGDHLHWRWRERFAERLAAAIDPRRFGVTRVFLIGSTEAGTAGPGSDIDLVVVFQGDAAQRHDLELWLEGWSLCLAEVSRENTGYHVEGGLLDVHIVDAPPDSAVGQRELVVGRGA
jgi:hypothetical protein